MYREYICIISYLSFECTGIAVKSRVYLHIRYTCVDIQNTSFIGKNARALEWVDRRIIHTVTRITETEN